MPIVRNRMSTWIRIGWRIRQRGGIARRHLTLPRNRMRHLLWMRICRMLMPHHVINSIGVGIIPVGEHLSLILIRIIYVHRLTRPRTPRREMVPTLQILRWPRYIFRLPWIQSRLWAWIHRIFYDVLLQSIMLKCSFCGGYEGEVWIDRCVMYDVSRSQ